MNTFKFSAIVRTIVAEATIYFLAMVALQIYIQISLVLMEVQCLSRFTRYTIIVDSNTSGHHSTTFVLVSILSTYR